MKLKASVAAVALAFSTGAVWAGDASKQESGATQPNASNTQQPAGAQQEELTWQFVNGQSATEQAAKPEQQDQSEQAAGSSAQDGSDQTADSEQKSNEQAESGGDASSDQAASEDESADQSAATEEETGTDRSAAAEEQEEGGQAGMSTDDEQDDQTAGSEDESASDQAASEDEGSDQSARSESAEGRGDGETLTMPTMPAELQDKVVVIVPKEWKGSISQLMAALQSSPDAQDIVVVMQENEPQAGTTLEEDEYLASRKSAVENQQ